MFLLGITLGAILGMFLTACIAADTINEYQSLVKESRQMLRNAEDEVVCLVSENKELHTENKDLRFENEELRDEIKKLVTDRKSEN